MVVFVIIMVSIYRAETNEKNRLDNNYKIIHSFPMCMYLASMLVLHKDHSSGKSIIDQPRGS